MSSLCHGHQSNPDRPRPRELTAGTLLAYRLSSGAGSVSASRARLSRRRGPHQRDQETSRFQPPRGPAVIDRGGVAMVLVVQADEVGALLASRALRRAGYAPRLTGSAAEAVKLLARKSFAAV